MSQGYLTDKVSDGLVGGTTIIWRFLCGRRIRLEKFEDTRETEIRSEGGRPDLLNEDKYRRGERCVHVIACTCCGHRPASLFPANHCYRPCQNHDLVPLW